MRQVRGTLFLDYVRMLRKARVDVSHLHADDVRWITTERIEPFEWYPMEAFERLGLAILDHVVGGETDAIRLWGRSRLEQVLLAFPDLLVPGDTVASIRQFLGFFDNAFDFPTVAVPVLEPLRLKLEVHYAMSPRAEEAAAWQTAGFFETVVTQSGGLAVHSTLAAHQWLAGGTATFELQWQGTASVPAPPAKRRPKVLVVDDEKLVVAAMKRLLSSIADVTTASGADEAVALLEREHFDGVLSDYAMPQKNGLWLLGEVAKRWPHTRRVLQSASMPAQAEAAKRMGVVHQLFEKPAPIDVLRAAFTFES